MRFLLPLIGLLALAGLASPSWAEDGAAAATATPAPTEPAPAEEADPTFADNLKAYGIELSEDEAKAVADYDAKPDGYVWPTYTTEDGEGSIAADLIGKIKEAANKDSYFTTSNLWLMLAAALVFIMHLGFATLESGLCRSKNTVNILFKNVMIVCIGLLTYALCGFVTMYPGSSWIIEGFFAFGTGVGFDHSDPVAYLANMTSQYGYPYTVYTDFLFQGMFAATAATIISGAVAERIKLLPFLIFVTLYVGFLYPVLGSWKWGGGWLSSSFTDFAGSTLVHSVGGWGALVAILILGPRSGKFTKDGVRPILPHNLPLAAIGVFLLWLGWFGFNGGSVLAAQGGDVSYVLVTTSLAAAMGGFAAGITSWVVGKKPDLSMALNGILAGLVGITAGPDVASIMTTLFIGLSSGVIVYFSVLTFDKLKIDDPVGALSVHLVCGIWGTMMVALSNGAWVDQFIGVIAYGGGCVVFALISGLIVKAIFGGLRVSTEEEEEGLDIGEHGTPAYHIPEAMGR